MKAVLVHEYGGSEKLEVHEQVETPPISKDQVEIHIRAASINPFDVA